jgi:hypothetical protein
MDGFVHKSSRSASPDPNRSAAPVSFGPAKFALRRPDLLGGTGRDTEPPAGSRQFSQYQRHHWGLDTIRIYPNDNAVTSAAPPVQTKLARDEADHPLEREADAIADNILRLPDSTPARYSMFEPRSTPISAHQSGSPLVWAPPIVHRVLASPGQPLDDATRAFFETRFQHDFSHVRVHTDDDANRSADAVDAVAYTAGNRIAFGRGLYSPTADSGRRLLAHELAHVVQQTHQSGGASSGATVLQRQGKSRASAPPPGGNILYIGMNNYPPEVATLRSLYAAKPVTVTTVTLSQEESNTKTAATGATRFNLTTDQGIDAFVQALALSPDQAKTVTGILAQAPAHDRDDLAHVIAIYAMTEADGKDRMSRVVLSGHSRGVSVYSKDNKGDILFSILVDLGSVFPKAAGQTKHVIAAACFAGDEAILLEYYTKAFPNLKTWRGWTMFSPTGSSGAAKIRSWARSTDVDPAQLPNPDKDEATWDAATGTYHGANPRQSPADAMSSLQFVKPLYFDDYFTGDRVGEKYEGDLPEFYARANSVANRRDISGKDHDEAQRLADQAYRLRFWKEQVAGFWNKYRSEIREGYGTAKVPDYAHLSRKAALAAIAAFAQIANGPQDKKDRAQTLLNALRDLDSAIMDQTWI